MGYENASDYEGGKQDWIEAGLPVERGAEEKGDSDRRRRSLAWQTPWTIPRRGNPLPENPNGS
jgi:hypothetical protein